ncbi:MAG: SAM-dependent methyltransferase [Winogradskyella sp.]|uniref:SAM-dependent methyltransferase n=1 Tax=Winogradskyella sp. TaxID=1883156 RepID=UPI00182BD09E|nr:SAM-dependent methyltransferase [Winogradskyella sp.]
MKKSKLDEIYWSHRYRNRDTGWNIGYISTPLKYYIDQLEDKSIKILIPGAGNSYEAEYLWQLGYKNVYIADIAIQPLSNFKERVPDFPDTQLLHIDFFDIEDSFDLILEQTFFCAINPSLRSKYVSKSNVLLKPKGKIVGLFFDFELTSQGPPFGGDLVEYKRLFSDYFYIRLLEKSINSIKERQGKELFFIFEKKTK